MDADPMVMKCIKEKLHFLPGYEDLLWMDNEHQPLFNDFCLTFHARKMYAYLEGESPSISLKVASNATTIKPSPKELIYLVRNPGLMTKDNVQDFVQVGRCKMPINRGMSDLQIMLTRRESRVSLELKSRLTDRRSSTGGLSPTLDAPRPKSLMPCHSSRSLLPPLHATRASSSSPVSPERSPTAKSSLRSLNSQKFLLP